MGGNQGAVRILVDGRMFRGRMHGLARYVVATLQAMARTASDWHFGVLEREGAFADLAAELPNIEPIPVQADPFTWAEHLEIPRRVAEWNPALFHAPTIAVPSGVRCRMVVTVPDLTPFHFPRRGWERLYFRWVLAPALRRARGVLVYSQHTAGDLVENLGVFREKITVTGLGVDPALARAVAPAALVDLRKRLGLEEGYVLCLANPKPHKNVEVLLKAWDKARPQVDLALVCPRAGWLDEALLSAHRVHRLDHVAEEDLPALYQGACLLVIPSLYEGFGLPAAEAMSAGTPVIAARAASLPEVVGQDGWLFDPRDPGDLAWALANLLHDPERRAELSSRGRARAARWTWEDAAQTHLRVYREALR